MLQRLKNLKDLCKEFLMWKSPAEVYWFAAIIWLSGALFGRWFL